MPEGERQRSQAKFDSDYVFTYSIFGKEFIFYALPENEKNSTISYVIRGIAQNLFRRFPDRDPYSAASSLMASFRLATSAAASS